MDTHSLIAYWCERPELFAQIADGKTEEARALAVLRWFIVSIAYSIFCPGLGKLNQIFFRVPLKVNIPHVMNQWDPRRSKSRSVAYPSSLIVIQALEPCTWRVSLL